MVRLRSTRLIFCALPAILALASAARAFDAETLAYTITPKFGAGRTRVELTWETRGRGTSVLSVASRFGRIENVEALLSNVHFNGAKSVRQDGPLWIVSHTKDAVLDIRYDVALKLKSFDDWDAQQLPIVTDNFFHGVGSAFLMTPNSHPGTPAEFETSLRWALPAGRKAACSWGGVSRSVAARVRPADLKQSVYLAGDLSTKTVEIGGLRISVAIVDDFAFSLDEFAEHSARIVKAECDFLAETSFPDFLVTAIPCGRPLREGETRIAGSGLYHSFALFVGPKAKWDDGIEHLFAHELFHHWNGRLLQAADPERLVYWFIEGFTDYYALRILHESRIWSDATYAKWLNKHLREYAANPAKNASNDDINARYWSERDTVGQVAYERGLLLGLRWNQLATQRGARDGVDALFRALLARARGGGFELTNSAVRQIGAQSLGPWFESEFDKHVVAAATVDVPADCLAPALTGKLETVYEHELGFDRVRSLKEKRVRGLIAASEAAKTGLRDGDELVSWDIPGNPDRKTRLQIKRNGKPLDIEYTARGTARQVLQFRAAGHNSPPRP